MPGAACCARLGADDAGRDDGQAADLPQAHSREYLRARLFLRAALPTVKVLLEDNLATREALQADVVATVQFVARNQPHAVGAYIRFDHGDATVLQGMAAGPTACGPT